jgi:hypothetical protein
MSTPRTEQIPSDVAVAIRTTKAELRDRIGDVEAAFSQTEEFIAAEVADIEATRARGEDVWPVIDYAGIAAGLVSEQDLAKVHRRGSYNRCRTSRCPNHHRGR